MLSLFNCSGNLNLDNHKRKRSNRLGKFFITKTCLYNADPLKPVFYIVKLGFTGIYIIFLILLKKKQQHRMELTIYVLSRNMKNIRIFLSENFPSLLVKFSTFLNRRV